MIISIDGYVMEADIEGTAEYYKSNSQCDCEYCRNFRALAKQKLPKLDAFLSQLGIDIARPDELGAIDDKGTTIYILVSYTVCGKILESDDDDIEIEEDGQSISLKLENGYRAPNEQTGEYFTVTAAAIIL